MNLRMTIRAMVSLLVLGSQGLVAAPEKCPDGMGQVDSVHDYSQSDFSVGQGDTVAAACAKAKSVAMDSFFEGIDNSCEDHMQFSDFMVAVPKGPEFDHEAGSAIDNECSCKQVGARYSCSVRAVNAQYACCIVKVQHPEFCLQMQGNLGLLCPSASPTPTPTPTPTATPTPTPTPTFSP